MENKRKDVEEKTNPTTDCERIESQVNEGLLKPSTISNALLSDI